MSGYSVVHPAAKAVGYSETFTNAGASEKVESLWFGLAGYATLSPLAIEKGFTDRFHTDSLSENIAALRLGSGESVSMDLASEMPDFRSGDLVTIDPPYSGTTGYGTHKLTRERVVEIALGAHACGARVAVHEAEPIITDGTWSSVELERRHGARQRTWSKQWREVLTISFEPKGQRKLWG